MIFYDGLRSRELSNVRAGRFLEITFSVAVVHFDVIASMSGILESSGFGILKTTFLFCLTDS